MIFDPLFKDKALEWAKQFDVALILDNNQCENAFGLREIEFALAAGVKTSVTGNGLNDWQKLEKFLAEANGESPVFSFLTYDLKNQIEELDSKHPDYINFPSLFVFVPEHLILIDKNHQLLVLSTKGNEIIKEILQYDTATYHETAKVNLKQRVSKETYIHHVNAIKNHILEGDVYELNYCVEFYAENCQIDPFGVYSKLKQNSPTPFGAFLKYHKQYLLCASPERFMTHQSGNLFSQPIKGTAPRDTRHEVDEENKEALANSEKEKAENLMIVDLVRNDMAKSCLTGTVEVSELFHIYSFKQVHQMISTVKGSKNPGVSEVESIANAFPMGSMTGAPKVKAMELIEQYENTKRGLYSGSIGYFAPNGDFDFNVVIRSIQYNEENHYLNFMVGSAITYDSEAEAEYEECMVKAKAMRMALGLVKIFFAFLLTFPFYAMGDSSTWKGFPQEKWVTPLTANSRTSRLSFARNFDQNSYTASMGGIFPILNFKRKKIAAQLSASGATWITLLRQEQAGFVINTDFFGELWIDWRFRQNWYIRTGTGHSSQHLSDDALEMRLPYSNYAKDYHWAGLIYQNNTTLQLYGMAYYNYNFKTQTDISGQWLLEAGFEHSPFKKWGKGLYYAANIKFKQELDFAETLNFQVGYKLGNPQESCLRICFDQTWGSEERGSFMYNNRNFGRVGIYLDL